jgi:DNA-binding CsgD family transcriptional regulator
LNLLVEESEQTCDRYCAYFAEFMQRRLADLKGRRQFAALKEIEADFENVRRTLRLGLSRKNYQILELASESLFLYCEMHGRFPEGQELLWAAQEQLDTEGDSLRPLWARLLVYSLWLWGLYDFSFEQFEGAKARLDEYLVIAREQGDTAQIALCQWVLGALGTMIPLTRNSVGAPDRLEQSLTLYTNLGDHFYMAKAADWLGFAVFEIGQQDRSIELSRQSLNWRRAIGDQFGAASALFNLVFAALWSGHYDQVRDYAQEMGEIYTAMGSRGWAARESVLLAWVAFQQGDFQVAQTLSEKVLAIVADTGMAGVGGEQTALTILAMLAALEEDYARSWRLCKRAGFEMGFPRPDEAFAIAACGLEDYSMARHYFLGALSWTSTVHVSSGMANLLSVAAILLAREGQPEQAVEMLGLAFHHPASAKRWMEAWPLLSRLRASLEAQLGTELYTAACERGKASDLETVVMDLLREFGAAAELTDSMAVAQSSLVDPLSERELEVLRLVAEGLSNPEIAQKLFLSSGTVKVHIRHIYEKLNVNSRVQAAARAKNLNLL